MGKTSSAVKEKYNKKAYEDLRVRVKTGKRDEIKAHAQQKGMSLNAYILDLIKKDSGVEG